MNLRSGPSPVRAPIDVDAGMDKRYPSFLLDSMFRAIEPT